MLRRETQRDEQRLGDVRISMTMAGDSVTIVLPQSKAETPEAKQVLVEITDRLVRLVEILQS